MVENHPLALCDRRTVEDDDWEPVDKVHADWVEEGMYLKRRDQHQWYWFSNQTNEELIAFVVWDSQRPRNFKGWSDNVCSVTDLFSHRTDRTEFSKHAALLISHSRHFCD